ncbi:septum site-determining protein MinC [Rhodoferax lacus]|uniref:Probable septum site-determining protein MinC n=1 Tax=Rhodoferax lacus TaxID=2184758 RepID=A0A3E1R8S3_9BURK|nr:septum site-determining protein MinC [Rhodoferax lacus]RFO95643.1 septum site-determining protein MinC [Rhodoferax lacus]
MSVKPKGPSSRPSPVNFEIKSAQLPLVALLLKSSRWEEVAADLTKQFGAEGESPDFFEEDPVVLDFSGVERGAELGDVTALLQALRQCHLLPLAFRAEPDGWTAQLLEAGLVQAPVEMGKAHRPPPAPEQRVQEVVREVPAPQTMVIDKPIRSGQKIYARGADLVVLAMVNQGAEVVADGNIHVYAPLRGKAMAGARGNTSARIFSLCLEPELISIAGVYRTSESPLPGDVAGKPAQVRLSSEGGQDKLLIEPLKN